MDDIDQKIGKALAFVVGLGMTLFVIFLFLSIPGSWFSHLQDRWRAVELVGRTTFVVVEIDGAKYVVYRDPNGDLALKPMVDMREVRE